MSVENFPIYFVLWFILPVFLLIWIDLARYRPKYLFWVRELGAATDDMWLELQTLLPCGGGLELPSWCSQLALGVCYLLSFLDRPSSQTVGSFLNTGDFVSFFHVKFLLFPLLTLLKGTLHAMLRRSGQIQREGPLLCFWAP